MLNKKLLNGIIAKINNANTENVLKDEGISFQDLAGLILYILCADDGLTRLQFIKTDKFRDLFQSAFEKWITNPENNYFREKIGDAWINTPGPADGGAGPAEMFFYSWPYLCWWGTSYSFFNHPHEDNGWGWNIYKEYVENYVFPRWKNLNNNNKVISVFNLADIIFADIDTYLESQRPLLE